MLFLLISCNFYNQLNVNYKKNTMKNTLLIIAFIATSISAVAQTNKTDKKLLVKYTVEELNTIKSENPEEYAFLNYCIDNAFYVAEMPAEKIKANPSKFGEVTIKNISKINFYQLNIELKEDEYQSFIIKGTKKILIVKSKAHILKELNNK